jgi:hypothetical protein
MKVLVLALSLAAPAAAHAQAAPPAVPANLEVPSGHLAFRADHAVGTQNYICLRTDKGYAWAFYGPQATLFDAAGVQQATHFLSPNANPADNGAARATWQHSADTSAVWAAAVQSSTDPNFVEPGAIPWLLLRVVGTQAGPDGGDALAVATYIQRVNTSGGIAPAAGCGRAADVGKKALVPYQTDYVFYR